MNVRHTEQLKVTLSFWNSRGNLVKFVILIWLPGWVVNISETAGKTHSFQQLFINKYLHNISWKALIIKC